MTDRSNRNSFRLEYPPDDRPNALIKTVQYPVIDISDGGIMMTIPDKSKFTILKDAFLTGTVQFGNRGSAPFKGHVVRVDDDSWAIRFSQPMMGPFVMSEQRYLIMKAKGGVKKLETVAKHTNEPIKK
jgi:hypothetical protein